MSFQFRLASVAKVRKNARHEKRLSLKETLTQEAEIASAITSFQFQLENLRQQREKFLQNEILPVRQIQQFHQCEQKLLEKISQRQALLDEIRQFAEEKRKALVTADQNVKTLEKLEEKQLSSYRQKILRKTA